MEGRMINITYRDRKTNIWVRDGQKSDIISSVRKIMWFCAGHTKRLKDDRFYDTMEMTSTIGDSYLLCILYQYSI